MFNFRSICILMVLSMSSCLVAQTSSSVPDAPRPVTKRPLLTKTDWVLAASVVGARTFDAYATESSQPARCQSRLPEAIAQHPVNMYLFSESVAIATIAGQVALEHTSYVKHHRWARAAIHGAQAVQIALVVDDGVNASRAIGHPSFVIIPMPAGRPPIRGW